MHPPFSLFAAPKRENGPCTVQKRKGRFWHSREPHASMEGRSGNLMVRRIDVLLFPRFAPSPHRAGKRVCLPAVGRRARPNVPGQARSAGRGARDDASKMQNNLGGTRRCGRAPHRGTLSDAAGRRLPGSYGHRFRPAPVLWAQFDPRGQIRARRLSFLFGPCTARFSFLWQDREKRNGGCICPAIDMAESRPRGASRAHHLTPARAPPYPSNTPSRQRFPPAGYGKLKPPARRPPQDE